MTKHNPENPIPVLHIIGSLRLGGAQVCLRDLLENFSDGRFVNHACALRGREIDVSLPGRQLTLPYRHYDPRKILAIAQYCIENRIRIIHAHLEKPILLALMLGKWLGIKVVIHEHATGLHENWKRQTYELLYGLLGRQADAYIAVSHNMAEYLRRRIGIPPGKIHIIPNSVNLEKFSPDPALPPMLREQYHIPPDALVIGYAGRLAPVKGPDLLVEAVSLLPRSRPFHLILAGDGPLRSKLEQRAQRLQLTDRITFTGFCPDINRLMNLFDIGVIPSRSESFGLTALEMMSMNIPFVCSGIGGLREFTQHNDNALITTENTPHFIARAILQLADDPQLCGRLTANACQTARQYAITTYTTRIAALYRELCGLTHL